MPCAEERSDHVGLCREIDKWGKRGLEEVKNMTYLEERETNDEDM